MKHLRIAQIAPYWFTVPPQDYGGTERVVNYVTESLVARGHDVTLFAAPGSQTAAKLISPVSQQDIDTIQSYGDRQFQVINNKVNEIVFSQAHSFDIIHSHASFYTFSFCDSSPVPVVHTIHNQLPRASAEENEIFAKYRHLNFVSISDSFKTHFNLNWVATVYHGLPMDLFPFDARGGEALFWVGRASKNKGELDAIEAARQTDSKLILAMSVRPDAKEYYDTHVAPRLTPAMQANYSVRFADLPGYYARAKAVLFPIAWEEPFGLVMIESMACGTPVIAYNRGSVPEVIKDGVTGFIIDPDEVDRPGKGSWTIKKTGIDGLVEAIRRIGEIDRAACRKHVEERFTVERMVEAYENVYHKVLM